MKKILSFPFIFNLIFCLFAFSTYPVASQDFSPPELLFFETEPVKVILTVDPERPIPLDAETSMILTFAHGDDEKAIEVKQLPPDGGTFRLRVPFDTTLFSLINVEFFIQHPEELPEKTTRVNLNLCVKTRGEPRQCVAQTVHFRRSQFYRQKLWLLTNILLSEEETLFKLEELGTP